MVHVSRLSGFCVHSGKGQFYFFFFLCMNGHFWKLGLMLWEDYIPFNWHLFTLSELWLLIFCNFPQHMTRYEQPKMKWTIWQMAQYCNFWYLIFSAVQSILLPCAFTWLSTFFYSGVFVFSFCVFYSPLTPGMYVVLISMVWGLVVLCNWQVLLRILAWTGWFTVTFIFLQSTLWKETNMLNINWLSK